MMFKKIRWQLIFSYLVVVLFSMGILGFFLHAFLRDYFIRDLEYTLSLHAHLVVNLWSRYVEQENPSPRERRLMVKFTQNLAWQFGSRICVAGPSGEILIDSSDGSPRFLQPTEQIWRALQGEESSEVCRSDDENPSPYISLVCPIKVEPSPEGRTKGKVLGFVYVTRSLAQLNEILSRFRKVLLAGTLLSLLISGLLSLWLSYHISHPLREMAKAAEKIAGGVFSQPVPIRVGSEIGELGERFNYMREKLRQTMGELLEEKNKMAAVLSTMADGVLMLDCEGRALMVNSAARRLLGLGQELPPGKEGALPPDLEAIIRKALKERAEGEAELRDLPGGRVAQVSYTLLEAGGSEPAGVVLVLRDITDSRRLDEMKTEFVTNVSHELKTPLASIKGFAELLLDGALRDEKQAQRFLLSIEREVERLRRLVKGLLDLSKMESGLLRIETRPVDLGQVVENVTSRMAPQAEGCGIKIETSIPPSSIVKADADRIEQVMINLLENALRHSPRGAAVRVRATRAGDYYLVEVIDRGPGLAKKDLPRIFERFYRVDRSRSRDHGGTGLGLAITKQIIETLGGKIWAESEIGKGCKMSFTLPVLEAETGQKDGWEEKGTEEVGDPSVTPRPRPLNVA